MVITIAIFLALVGMLSFFYVYFGKIYDVMLKKDMEQIEWTSYFVTKLIHQNIEHSISGLQAGERIFHDYEELGREKALSYLREMKEGLGFEKIGIVGVDGKNIDDTGKVSEMDVSELLEKVQESINTYQMRLMFRIICCGQCLFTRMERLWGLFGGIMPFPPLQRT